MSGDWSSLRISASEFPPSNPEMTPTSNEPFPRTLQKATSQPPEEKSTETRSNSPPQVSTNEAFNRAVTLSKKLWSSNIPTQVSPTGDLMLDMTGYKSSEEQALRAEVIARKILSEELEGNYDIGAMIGADEKGNLWIYSSEEAKEAADRKAGLRSLNPTAMRSTDAISDPGYHSDDGQSDTGSDIGRERRDSDSALGTSITPEVAGTIDTDQPIRNYAKTLRLTSEQLKTLDLKPGANSMSFTVNRSTCQAFMYYWRHDVPIVISDIDGTITK
jgi:phosphatidate phosphatase LPIN